MKITALGEFGLIERFAPPFRKGLGRGIVGIGDDCAVIPWKRDRVLLVTTDLLVEGVHFLRRRIAPEDLGAKALAVNLSDIAAMGGTPASAFLSLGLPSDIEVAWTDRFFRGLGRLAVRAKVRLLGGDTTRSERDIIINIAVFGSGRPSRIKFRSTARPGDVIAVTGTLGDSAAGLRLLLGDRGSGRDERTLIAAHVRPRPQLEEGRWLAGQAAVRALIDVSDGIDSDLRRIAEASGCGAVVELEHLPLSPSFVVVCRRQGWDPLECAAAGGEDYCLLATIAARSFPSIAVRFARRFKRPLFPIGRIAERRRGFAYRLHGRDKVLAYRGFDHFRPQRPSPSGRR
jgi:thiamine-monophosphate kinase